MKHPRPTPPKCNCPSPPDAERCKQRHDYERTTHPAIEMGRWLQAWIDRAKEKLR